MGHIAVTHIFEMLMQNLSFLNSLVWVSLFASVMLRTIFVFAYVQNHQLNQDQQAT